MTTSVIYMNPDASAGAQPDTPGHTVWTNREYWPKLAEAIREIIRGQDPGAQHASHITITVGPEC